MNKKEILKWALVVNFPFLLLFVSYYAFAFSSSYYEYHFEKENIVNSDMGIQVLDFLEGNAKLDTEFFTEKEIAHLEDVKLIMNKVNILFLALIILWIFGFRYYDNKKEIVKLSGCAGFLLLGVLLLLLFFFDWSFIVFHKIFFVSGTWQFARTNLVLIFTNVYFIETFRNIIVLFGVLCLVSVLVGKFSK